MRSVSTLVNQTNLGTERPVQQLNEQAAWAINDIFKSLMACFPAWKVAFPTDHELNIAKKVWVKGLMEAGITDLSAIQNGMRNARASENDFFPSVGKFIKWCKQPVAALGLPDVQAAYHQACQQAPLASRGTWSHPAVYHAAANTGFHDLARSVPGDAAAKQFVYHYGVMCARAGAGEDLEIPVPTAIEHDTTPTQEEIAANQAAGTATISELRGLFNAH